MGESSIRLFQNLVLIKLDRDSIVWHSMGLPNRMPQMMISMQKLIGESEEFLIK